MAPDRLPEIFEAEQLLQARGGCNALRSGFDRISAGLVKGVVGVLLLPLLLSACSGEDAHRPGSDGSAARTAVDAEALNCLALSMYWEAKAEGDVGMLAVGHVVLNRMDHEAFPNSPCAVVFDGGERPPCQFSWWCDGRSDKPTETGHWQRAQTLARRLLTEPLADPTGGALFFHSTAMATPWKRERRRTAVIGGHVFYTIK